MALRHEWILEGLPLQILEHHMTLHNIEVEELPPKIKVKFDEFMKSKKRSERKLNSKNSKSGIKNLSTGRKPVKRKIDTEINHVPVIGGDMITMRNKDKKVNINKGLENSILDSLSSKSKSNTRNKSKNKRSKADLSLSSAGDSLKALDDLMGIPRTKKAENTNNFIVKKTNIKFKPLRRGGLKHRAKKDRITENTEKKVLQSKKIKQSRNKNADSFAPSELNMIDF